MNLSTLSPLLWMVFLTFVRIVLFRCGKFGHHFSTKSSKTIAVFNTNSLKKAVFTRDFKVQYFLTIQIQILFFITRKRLRRPRMRKPDKLCEPPGESSSPLHTYPPPMGAKNGEKQAYFPRFCAAQRNCSAEAGQFLYAARGNTPALFCPANPVVG